MRCWWIIWSVDLLQSLPHRMMRFSATNLQSSIVSLMEVSNELKGHRGDQRRALTTLYDHPNMAGPTAGSQAHARCCPTRLAGKLSLLHLRGGYRNPAMPACVCLILIVEFSSRRSSHGHVQIRKSSRPVAIERRIRCGFQRSNILASMDGTLRLARILVIYRHGTIFAAGAGMSKCGRD